jgi:predicted transcriptional regulator
LNKRLLLLLAVLASPVSMAAVAPESRVLFSYDGPMSLAGAVDAVCDGAGAVLPAEGSMVVHAEGGEWVEWTTYVNVTVLTPEAGPKPVPVDANITSRSARVPAGPVRIAWPADGIAVLWPHAFPNTIARPLEISGAVGALNATSVEHAPPAPAGARWVPGSSGRASREDTFFPGWSRRLTSAGSFNASGDLMFYLRQARVESVATGWDLPAYRQETSNTTTALASVRTLKFTDAELRLRVPDVALPSGSRPVCSGLDARVRGAFVAEAASGEAFRDGASIRFNRRALTLQGTFDLRETTTGDEPTASDRGRVEASAEGDVRLVGLDYETVASTSAPKAVAIGSGAALLLLILAFVVKKAGTLVGFFYSRFGRDRALENRNRELVHDAVCNNPGADLSTLAQITGLNRRTLAYHVQVLERVGLVVTRRQGRSLRILPIGLTSPQAVASVFATKDPRYVQVVEALRAGPIPLSELVRTLRERLRIGRRAAYLVVDQAIEHGIVRRSSDGREVTLACEPPS